MKTAFKYSLLGGIIGAIMMFAVVVIIEWDMDEHPAIDTQVIHYLESKGYPVDSLEEGLYTFQVGGYRYVFDFLPDDPTYFHIWAGYNLYEFSREDVMIICANVMNAKKNCVMIPQESEAGMAIQVCCESFLDSENLLDTKIIDRSIQILQDALFETILRLHPLREELDNAPM